MCGVKLAFRKVQRAALWLSTTHAVLELARLAHGQGLSLGKQRGPRTGHRDRNREEGGEREGD